MIHLMNSYCSERRFCGAIPFTLTVFLACLPPPAVQDQTVNNEALLEDATLKALYIPLQQIAIHLQDETRSSPDSAVSEAFFVDIANALAQYEVSKRFRVMLVASPDTPSVPVTQRTDSLLHYFRSRLRDGSGSTGAIAATVRSIAEQCSVDLVILPLMASVQETLTKQEGWRRDKFGQSYERPVTCVAEALFVLEIYDRTGKLVYRRIGKSVTRQPLLYSLLKREAPKNEDLVHFSKNVFAPPMIRALSSAIKETFPIGRSEMVRGRRY